MRFAIISDIHGNLPALDAVLEDANNNNIDNFIFVCILINAIVGKGKGELTYSPFDN